MKLPRIVYAIAGVYGLITLVPTCFLEARIGLEDPPAITHPEYYYGFVGVALAWQLLFLLIASDPVRFRPAMPVALIEKLAFGVAVAALYAARRVHAEVLGFGMIDLLLGALFVLAYFRTPKARSASEDGARRALAQAEANYPAHTRLPESAVPRI